MRLPLEPAAIVEIVSELLHPFEASSRAKRQKHDERPVCQRNDYPQTNFDDRSTEVEKAERSVSDLTTLIESRDWTMLPGDATLVAALMSILSALLAKRQVVKEGLDYLEQEVLAAILVQVERIEVRLLSL